MTRALVVFESMFGNTEAIAHAVADGLRSTMDVDVVEVGAAPASPADDVDLLVVGGPTHAFGLTRPSTRQDAARQAGHAVGRAGSGCGSGCRPCSRPTAWPPWRSTPRCTGRTCPGPPRMGPTGGCAG
jgi:flavorubredoxin